MGYLSEIYQTELTKRVYPLLKNEKTDFEEKSEEVLADYSKKLRRNMIGPLKYRKRTFNIVTTDYLPSFVLGMTDCNGKIWVSRVYSYFKEYIVRHEILHNLFPNLDEYEVEMLNRAGCIESYRNFNLVYSL